MYPRLILDLPVSLNKMYMPSGGRIILSPDARNWKLYAELVIRSQWQCEPLEGELVVYCYYYGSRLDADNGTKLLFDSMNGVVWIDDVQVSELHIYVNRGKTFQRHVEVEVHHKQGNVF